MHSEKGSGARQEALEGRLSHVEEEYGRERAKMVDVGEKPVEARSALARARVRFPEGLLGKILDGKGPKGAMPAIQEMARAAGCLGAKKTGELIPLCHPLGLDHVDVTFEEVEADVLEVLCRSACRGRTGVEMEALVGASLAALTVYDMTKALDPAIRIEAVELLEKRGGKRGLWQTDRD